MIEQLRTEYNDVHVWQRADGIDFEVAGGTHATWTPGRIMTGYAWDALTAAALLRDGPPPRHVLMLGLGGATVVRQLLHFLPEVRITAVEIDRGMVDLARRHMRLDDLAVETIIGDAYEVCAALDRRFDIVIDDLYLGQARDVARPAEFDAHIMRLLTARTAPGGLVLANLVTGSGHKAAQRAARDAFRRHFPTVYRVCPAKGFNETLAGGHTLVPARSLRHLDRQVSNPHDLTLWQAIRVTRLPATGSSDRE